MEVIFNFSRYDELRQAVRQLLQESLDEDHLYDEAHDLFDAWWESNQTSICLNDEAKKRAWQAMAEEFMPTRR